MGFHQGLTGESYDRNYSNKTLLARIWVYARPYKKLLFSSMVIVIFQAIMGALPPVLVSKSRGLQEQSQESRVHSPPANCLAE